MAFLNAWKKKKQKERQKEESLKYNQILLTWLHPNDCLEILGNIMTLAHKLLCYFLFGSAWIPYTTATTIRNHNETKLEKRLLLHDGKPVSIRLNMQV